MVFDTILSELEMVELIDPHTHIDPHAPHAATLADILGYHYYTELTHSAGLDRRAIEEEGLDPREKTRRIVAGLDPIRNTVQYSWLMEVARDLFGFEEPHLDETNWERLYEAVEEKGGTADRADQMLRQSGLAALFLTNDFDDPLEGFDTAKYIPCLRTDDLVFHLAEPSVRRRLAEATGIEVACGRTLHEALVKLFEHFRSRGAKACAISLPPDFAPVPVPAGRADQALALLAAHGREATPADRQAAARHVFWSLAEQCAAFRLPFDLMIGVQRRVYRQGVYQGQDLFDHRVSLSQYAELFNAFPGVTFPVSVLPSTLNQELVSYAWIFPNVVTLGHWWYSNLPTYIESDVAARLEGVPQSKQIGYYSDMYKLEFALPKFRMYRRVLARVLADRFVRDRGWTEEAAVELGRRVLRGNVEAVFGLV